MYGACRLLVIRTSHPPVQAYCQKCSNSKIDLRAAPHRLKKPTDKKRGSKLPPKQLYFLLVHPSEITRSSPRCVLGCDIDPPTPPMSLCHKTPKQRHPPA